MAVPAAFLARALDPSPALRVTFSPWSDEKPRTIAVEHRVGSRPTRAARDYLASLAEHAALREIRELYKRHDGLQLCRAFDARYGEVRPLLELKPAECISGFTARYRPAGDLAWTMDLNKSKSLYRSSAPWLAFAEIDSGPACLTIFLDGDHAGSVFLATPQPWFNILRPIAKSFYALLARIGEDVAAFLRLVRATVSLRGDDGRNYGFVPVQYLSSGNVPRGGPGRVEKRGRHSS